MTNKVTLDFFFDREDDWGANYNNQDFFQYNIERLRWCLVEADHLEGNPFTGCIDLNTLEVKDLKAFDLLYSLDHKELMKMVEDKDWDWIGDDFEHMWQYLNFITDHDKTFMYNTRIMGEDEWMHIYGYNIPEKYQQGELREAYLAGQSDAEKGLS